jgi:REP element-mobilizing transposase RayT
MKPAKDEREKGGKRTFRKSLRNTAINYRNGWFFVTCQVAHNKSIFGAIVGERCELNPFGLQIEAYWRGLPAKYPELELDEFVLMPNHFHAIVRIHYRPTNKEHHLGFLMSRFKGGAGYIYGKLRRAGEVEDIGEHLWQFDYWDKIVTNERQLEAFRRYIRENPKNWSRDRFGAVTQYSFGNLELLRGPCIAFVASQGFWASELKPRLVWRDSRDLRAEARRTDMGGGGCAARRIDIGEGGCAARRTDMGGGTCAARRTDMGGGGCAARRTDMGGGGCVARRTDMGEGGYVARRTDMGGGGCVARHTDMGGGEAGEAILECGASAPPPLISTFTSAQEREVLRRALAKGRRVIQVVPQGIPRESDLLPQLLTACRERRALLLSPQPPGSRLNKKVATWCNEYVLRHASEIWVGDISANGMLASMLKALGRG